MKYHIERNSVEETLVIPLFARSKSNSLYPRIYKDETATALINGLDYDFSSLEKTSRKAMYRFGYLEVACRQNDISIEINEYLSKYPKASIVNLGCGLDSLASRYASSNNKVYNLDFKSVIDIRNKLLPPKENEFNLACDINVTNWFDNIDTSSGVIFFASGVFYYFRFNQVEALINKMSAQFPNGRLVFDIANKKASKLIKKTWLKKARIKDVDSYFYISNAKKELSSLNNIEISSKDYMHGYNSLKDKSIPGLFRLLAKLGDKLMKMRIVRIDFKG